MKEPQINWRRNLAALWFAEFTAIFGFSFTTPFLPLFLKDLGIHQQSELAAWTGIVASASGLVMAVVSPLWGVLGDRYGRKAMLLRAMVGGGISVGLLGLAANPIHMLLLRVLQGGTSGTVAAATALVASGTPRNRVGWAMGILTSSIAAGSAVGPVVGGLLASTISIRAIFFVGGALLLFSVLPVWLAVEEPALERRTGERAPALQVLRSSAPGTLTAVEVLLVCQSLIQMSYSAFQPLVALHLIPVAGSGAAAATGLTFGLAGAASAVAAVVYSSAARRFGYVAVALWAGLLMGGAEIGTGFAPSVALVILAGGLAGLFYGAVGPSISSMLGLEAPAEVQARVFGISASATAIGFGLGPLLGGSVAALASVPLALGMAGAFGVVLAGVVFFGAREPALEPGLAQ
ncbi:MAG TPA: MFS transporter [Candidatus Dormibacteraeota bacterium]